MDNQPPRFPDIENHWARPFIEGLAARKIVSGFPDGTYKPEQPTTRAQFAALITAIFRTGVNRPYVPFIDVSKRHWAAKAIQKAYETGYLSGYPGNRFRPEASIARVEALVSLASGLGIDVEGTTQTQAILPEIYEDAKRIPNYATRMVAAATYGGLVANFPNLKLLRPTEVATRADIAAFVYQALELGGKVEPVTSEYLVIQQRSAITDHTRELRGVWLTTIWSKGWPSRRGMSVEEQQRELREILDRIQALNLNLVLWQVRPTGDAMYASELEPWSEWLTGVEGQAPEPFYDPLEFIIDECHQRGLEFHAWFTLYRARVSSLKSPNVSPHLAVTNPEVVYEYGSFLWMDPGSQVVQDRIYNVIRDVVNRYDVDGIHIDDYFYPYPGAGAGKPFPDEQTYERYVASLATDDGLVGEPGGVGDTDDGLVTPEGDVGETDDGLVTPEGDAGGMVNEGLTTQLESGEEGRNEELPESGDVEEEVDEITDDALEETEGEEGEEEEEKDKILSLADWRRDNVNRIVERISGAIKEIKPYVKFGISPFGIYRSGEPEGITGFNQYDGIFTDPKRWLDEGWVDYLAPQLYWGIEPPAQSYPVLLRWWTQQNPQQRHIYPGNALYKSATKGWNAAEYEAQVDETRLLMQDLSLGNIFFEMKIFNRNPALVEFFEANIYSEPALVPIMPWLVQTQPLTNPVRLRGREDRLSWWLREESEEEIRSWSLYRMQGDAWRLEQILAAATREVMVEPGTYALCAVDRMGQESTGIVAVVAPASNRLR